MNDAAAAPESAPAAPRAPRRGLRITLWSFGILAALIVALLLFARYALPGIVRSQAERIGSQTLHRNLQVGAVEIHPLTLEFALQGVRLMEADGRSVFASFERLDARLSWSSLTHLAPVVREIHLAGPYLHFVRKGPHEYSTDDISAALAEQARKAPPAPPSSGLPRFAVHNIRIDGGRFEFDDEPEHAQHTVADLALGVPFLSTFPAEEEIAVDPLLKAVVDGAPLEVRGSTLPFAPTPEANVDLQFADLDLTRLAPYLPADAGLRLGSAHLALQLHLAVHVPKGEAPTLHAQGKVGLSKVELGLAQASGPLRWDALELDLVDFEWPAGRFDAALTETTKAGKGRLAVAGAFGVAPLHADLNLGLEAFDLLPLQPFFADRVNLRVTRAALAGKGHLHLEQAQGGPLRGGLQGDFSLPKLATIDALKANDFVSWDLLSLHGLDVQLQPFALKLDELGLNNLYARVIVDPAGRINLQDIAKGKAEAGRSLTEAAPVPAAPSAAPAPPPKPAAPLPPVAVNRIVLQGGHVRYTDNFIQPRYSADLMDLHGTVGGLSSKLGTAAEVDLHGKVNDAPLLIAGTVNPLLANPALDIKGSVHDMELAGLSPYSGKYVGYRIERGKLSFEADYHLKDRQLQAGNHLVLDQLTFGDKVDSKSATSLPVQLAIALLKDRNGVIDIDLPIGGSLDDPQFSVGKVIVQVLSISSPRR
jgi:hypothetical protein